MFNRTLLVIVLAWLGLCGAACAQVAVSSVVWADDTTLNVTVAASPHPGVAFVNLYRAADGSYDVIAPSHQWRTAGNATATFSFSANGIAAKCKRLLDGEGPLPCLVTVQWDLGRPEHPHGEYVAALVPEPPSPLRVIAVCSGG